MKRGSGENVPKNVGKAYAEGKEKMLHAESVVLGRTGGFLERKGGCCGFLTLPRARAKRWPWSVNRDPTGNHNLKLALWHIRASYFL